MAKKIEVYGVPPGGSEDEWLPALYVNSKVENDKVPARDCIKEALERRGCVVSSIRKCDVLEHELL